MPQVGRQQRQPRLRVRGVSGVPVKKRVDREAVAEVVRAWPAAPRARFKPDGLDEPSEHEVDALGEQSGCPCAR